MSSRSGKSGPSLAVGFLLVALIGVVFSILQAGSHITGWDWRTGFGMPVCFFCLVILYLHGVLGTHLALTRSMMERDLKDRRLEQIRKATSCLWWEIDREGVVAETTEGEPTIPGFDPKAMIGKSLLDFIPQEDREMVKAFLDEHALKRNPFQGLEHRLLTRDGHEQWVRVNGIPRFDDQDSITGFQIMAVPIGELKETKLELQHKEFELRNLIDILPGLFYRCLPGPDGAFLFINPEIESLTGYSMAEFLNDGRRSFRALIHPDDAHQVQIALLKAIEEHRYYEIRYHLCRSDGEIRQVLERGRAFYDRNGEVLHLDGAVIDVTGELERTWATTRSVSA